MNVLRNEWILLHDLLLWKICIPFQWIGFPSASNIQSINPTNPRELKLERGEVGSPVLSLYRPLATYAYYFIFSGILKRKCEYYLLTASDIYIHISALLLFYYCDYITAILKYNKETIEFKCKMKIIVLLQRFLFLGCHPFSTQTDGQSQL